MKGDLREGSRSKSGYSKDRSTLYQELNEYQKRLKADANSQKIYQVQLWECKELLVELHQEYYDELLQYRDEFREYCLHYRPDDFIKSKKDTKNKDG